MGNFLRESVSFLGQLQCEFSAALMLSLMKDHRRGWTTTDGVVVRLSKLWAAQSTSPKNYLSTAIARLFCASIIPSNHPIQPVGSKSFVPSLVLLNQALFCIYRLRCSLPCPTQSSSLLYIQATRRFFFFFFFFFSRL
ncbi:hypothetical protein MAP00_000489 [Monascus purpureus]|nr:hypothetical protein MAP00_000489 [Monascus purpureus]